MVDALEDVAVHLRREMDQCYRGLHSTEVAFALLTVQPWVLIPALLRFFSTALFVGSGCQKSNPSSAYAKNFANTVQLGPELQYY